MAKILLADDNTADSFLVNLLKPKHEICRVTMMEAAHQLKNSDFDLIIIDLHFDQSRMFDAMHLVKSIARNASKPIICVGTRSDRTHRPLNESLDFTTRAMGAWMYLDVHAYNQTQDPRAELSRIIERCLVGEARKVTRQARIDIHKQRNELHKLRSVIENEDSSEEVEERLAELRQKLTSLLLDLCELNMGTISQQEQIDESRSHHDRVSSMVEAVEDKATQIERTQTHDELEHAVNEYRISEREQEADKRRRTSRRKTR